MDRNYQARQIPFFLFAVAPLAGSVDRNPAGTPDAWWYIESLPSRGAWIEIGFVPLAAYEADRRSPRGERG